MGHGFKCKTDYKTLRKKIKRKPLVFWVRQRILRLDKKVQSIRGKGDKMDFIKTKYVCSAKYSLREWKRENICKPHIKDWYLEYIFWKLLKSAVKKENPQKENGHKKWNSMKKIYRWQTSTWKDV